MAREFTELTIHADIEQASLGLVERPAHGVLTDIGLMRHGTARGKATVGMVVELDDGQRAYVETTWALFRLAARSLAVSPIAAEEVIDP